MYIKTRIKKFYDLINQGQYAQCYDMLDTEIKGKITLEQYIKSLYGMKFDIDDINVDIHDRIKSRFYGGRPFAIGKTKVKDGRILLERWVKNGDEWFTRMTGLCHGR